MNVFRRAGMYLSLSIISLAGAFRYWSAIIVRGQDGSRGVRVIVIHGRRVLLVSHWFAPWAWTLPGGGVGSAEDTETAAKREIEEETGLKVRSLAGMIGEYSGSMGERERVTVYYTGDISGSLSMVPNMEIMARSWFDIDHLPPELSPANRRRIEAYRDGVRNEKGTW